MAERAVPLDVGDDPLMQDIAVIQDEPELRDEIMVAFVKHFREPETYLAPRNATRAEREVGM